MQAIITVWSVNKKRCLLVDLRVSSSNTPLKTIKAQNIPLQTFLLFSCCLVTHNNDRHQSIVILSLGKPHEIQILTDISSVLHFNLHLSASQLSRIIYSKANAEFNKIIKFWSVWPYWQFIAELRVLKTVPVQASMYE